MSTYDMRDQGQMSRIDAGGGALGEFFDFDFPELTEDEKRRAMLYVCDKADDIEDARLLLEALGLHGNVSLPSGKSKCPECGGLMVSRHLPVHREKQHGVAA